MSVCLSRDNHSLSCLLDWPNTAHLSTRHWVKLHESLFVYCWYDSVLLSFNSFGNHMISKQWCRVLIATISRDYIPTACKDKCFQYFHLIPFKWAQTNYNDFARQGWDGPRTKIPTRIVRRHAPYQSTQTQWFNSSALVSPSSTLSISRPCILGVIFMRAIWYPCHIYNDG